MNLIPNHLKKIGYIKDDKFSVIDTILQERHGNYGDYSAQCALSQGMKDILHAAPNWEKMPADRKEAIDICLVKFARLVNGNSGHKDSWDDIGGYAKLVSDTLV